MLKKYIFILLLALIACRAENKESFIINETDKAEFIPNMESVKMQLAFVWLDDFSNEEKLKLKTWLYEVSFATQMVLGNYPFYIKFHLHRVQSEKKPVTSGFTRHDFKKDVHLFVDPSHDIDVFMNDWIGPHEVSHLALPHVGRQNAWFAEGFATYMSRQIMVELGVYTDEEVEAEYLMKFDQYSSFYDSDLTFSETALKSVEEKKYAQMYWSSVGFFYRANQQLEDDYNLTLVEIIKAYEACCRMKDKTLNDIVTSFDSLSKSRIFSIKLDEYQNKSARDIFENFAE